MSDAVIVQNLGKRFRRYRSDRPSTIHEALLRFWKLAPTEYFWGLKDVNFRIAPGRMVAVVGRNGAGKSTLLRLIGGVGRPDEGNIQVNGRTRGLLTLGAGFHPELTGRENLYVNAIIGGLTRREVDARLDSIIGFSELDEYIDSPLRVYSSGMQMRLAFSIAIHSDPDVLLIDEVLAVGDQAFQRKCLDRIEQVKASGCTIIVVSHDAGMARELCDEALWLRAGRLEAYGPCTRVVEKYLTDADSACWSHLPVANTASTELSEPPAPVVPEEPIFEITAVHVLPHESEASSGISLEIGFVAHQRVETLNFSFVIRRQDGVSCCDLSTQESLSTLGGVFGVGTMTLHIDRLDLGGGRYDAEVCAFGEDPSQRLAFWHRSSFFAIPFNGANSGLWQVPHRWETAVRSEDVRSSVAGVR